ncbi:MAG: TRAP transporter substrate-binding protein DctP [Gammaproteobacteria bacterium]|nr:TRAP transporter substrate-binding protein DctP [Gammaproteobacteria bacterium]MDH3537216.1 TRAP transporter substrate-binding protein DctP [Gammaproteobacteria bacterium]
MKRFIQVCSIAFCLYGFSGPTTAMTFKIATLAPAGTVWMVEMKNGAKLIHEKTDGRVKFKFYPGGVMGGEKTVHQKIRAGQLHGGAFSSAGLAHLYPDIQSLNIPMMFDSLDEVDYVRAKMEPQMKANLEQRGFVLLGITEIGFSLLLSKTPIRDLASIQGSKLWAPQGDVMVQETYRSLGLSPVSLPISDVYTGLQTGLLETVTATPSAAIAFQWHSSTGYVTATPLAYLVGLLAIDKRAFDKISVADQSIVRQEMESALGRLDRLTRADNLEAAAALRSQGIKFIEPEPDEVARWKALAKQSIEPLIDRGALTRAGVDEVRRHLRDFRQQARHDPVVTNDKLP